MGLIGLRRQVCSDLQRIEASLLFSLDLKRNNRASCNFVNTKYKIQKTQNKTKPDLYRRTTYSLELLQSEFLKVKLLKHCWRKKRVRGYSVRAQQLLRIQSDDERVFNDRLLLLRFFLHFKKIYFSSCFFIPT